MNITSKKHNVQSLSNDELKTLKYFNSVDDELRIEPIIKQSAFDAFLQILSEDNLIEFRYQMNSYENNDKLQQI